MQRHLQSAFRGRYFEYRTVFKLKISPAWVEMDRFAKRGTFFLLDKRFFIINIRLLREIA